MSYYNNATISSTVSAHPITMTIQRLELSANDTTSSATYVSSTLTLTLANRIGGRFMSYACCDMNGTSGSNIGLRMVHDGTVHVDKDPIVLQGISGGSSIPITCSAFGALDGTTVEVEFLANVGSAQIRGGGELSSHLVIFEMGGSLA